MITNSVQFFKGKNYNIKNDDCQVIFAAWKFKTPGNIGQLIRLAHNIGANKVLFIDSGHIKRVSEIRKMAGFSYNQMKWEFISEDEFLQRASSGFSLVAVETSLGSENIYTVDLPSKTIFLLGNETNGIPGDIIQKCSTSIHIPMPGGCKSLNVSHAAAVVAFEWFRQKYFGEL
ncbi:hypothetical protein MNBD_BACTEROID01-2537 [hydrothermal vent metagenome]|uniref:tRNA/rRNA methyltransferase SpoU type domain-containing protein n=1 Tax=hydrothermal vent metagenome TaxID=652676 RepID=A0A3B0U1E8_9ZZZZ